MDQKQGDGHFWDPHLHLPVRAQGLGVVQRPTTADQREPGALLCWPSSGERCTSPRYGW